MTDYYQVLELGKLGISAFAYCCESLADARRKGLNLTDAVKSCKTWWVICVDPEHLRDGAWRAIAECPAFRAKLLYSAVDEVHLIKLWGLEFRKDFGLIGQFFRGCFPSSASVVGLSATLAPGADTSAICASLGFFDAPTEALGPAALPPPTSKRSKGKSLKKPPIPMEPAKDDFGTTHPRSSSLPPSWIKYFDNLLLLVSSSDLYPLLDQWYHRETHTNALFEAVVEIQTKIHGKRERRKAVDSGQIRRAKRRKKVADSEDKQEPESDLDYDEEPEFDLHVPSDPDFPAALLPAVLSGSRSRVRKKWPLDNITNISSRRTRAPVQKLADVVKDYGPQYRTRVRK
ncbi:hypothetical protein B0H14DRAFT_3530566 [Mycena olivaceomarginata]|nr:hypothetical protein B0H14DRAFT_3530566 [Mycena olivaceomarginata]